MKFKVKQIRKKLKTAIKLKHNRNTKNSPNSGKLEENATKAPETLENEKKCRNLVEKHPKTNNA